MAGTEVHVKMNFDVEKNGRRFTRLWLKGTLSSIPFPSEERNKKSGILRMRANGTGLLVDTSQVSLVLRFQFDTPEYEVPEEELDTIQFWEMLTGLRYLSPIVASRTLDEAALVEAMGGMIRRLWDEACVIDPVPSMTICPFKFEYSKEFGLFAILPDNQQRIVIRTTIAA